ncbi:MAG: hypothetical protein OXR62_00230 [Ahrensia sp.]|nr:hypothetical protein [Ahrensia sp.]
MMHRATASFWRKFDQLPDAVQSVARKNFELLKRNPSHPSLRFKPISQVWSVRVGLGYRALALKRDDAYYWFWVGSHADYDRLIS